jgi:hypothetical protein
MCASANVLWSGDDVTAGDMEWYLVERFRWQLWWPDDNLPQADQSRKERRDQTCAAKQGSPRHSILTKSLVRTPLDAGRIRGQQAWLARLTTDRLLALHGSVEQLWVTMLLTLFSDTIRVSLRIEVTHNGIHRCNPRRCLSAVRATQRENVPGILNRIRSNVVTALSEELRATFENSDTVSYLMIIT